MYRKKLEPAKKLDYSFIRAGSGLGDSLYLQSVCRHLVAQGKHLNVCSNYPEIFSPLGDRVTLHPFKREGVGIVAHYTQRRHNIRTTQFEDCCIQAGITERVELTLDWKHKKRFSFDRCRFAVIGLPRAPMGRDDGMAMELLPDMQTYQRVIDAMRARGFLIVQVGAGEPLYSLERIDIDLANKTTVSEMIDVVSLSDAVVCYPSFLIPLAESLGKKYLTVFSAKGLVCHKIILRQITPEKLIHRKELGAYIMDDKPEEVASVTASHFY